MKNMSDATLKQITAYSKVLEKFCENPEDADKDEVHRMLDYLSSAEVSLHIIQKTRIGLHVNTLRKVSLSESINQKAKKIVKSWKKFVEKNKPVEQSSNGNGHSQTIKSEKAEKPDKVSEPAPKSTPSTPASRPTYPTSSGDNSVRGRYRTMLIQALRPDDDDEDVHQYRDIEQLAAEIEEEIFKDLKRPEENKYRNRVISRVSNLKDKRNPDFKKNCLIGLIPPSRIAIMSHEEMASKELAELRKQYIKEGIADAQMAFTQGAKSTEIKCPNCKKYNCTYNQVQTRSADEPMTTFCFCNECGKRWKFC